MLIDVHATGEEMLDFELGDISGVLEFPPTNFRSAVG
jgi:hypothetical protein